MPRRTVEPDTTTEILAMIPALRVTASGFLRDSDAADDLVQETLVKALASISGFRPGTDLRAWLFTIMRNSFLSGLRRAGREVPDPADCAPPDPICQPRHDLRLGCGELLDAIRRVPLPYREALILVFVLEEGYEEAARICGCPVGTIKSRVSRARSMLMADLGARSVSELVSLDG